MVPYVHNKNTLFSLQEVFSQALVISHVESSPTALDFPKISMAPAHQ
jgi:hypothetical protein